MNAVEQAAPASLLQSAAAVSLAEYAAYSTTAHTLMFHPMKINKRAIWNGYLVTLVVRGVGGAILGAGVGILFCYRGVLQAIGEDHFAALGYMFLISSGIGLVVGMATSPEESLPWRTIKNLEKRQQEKRH